MPAATRVQTRTGNLKRGDFAAHSPGLALLGFHLRFRRSLQAPGQVLRKFVDAHQQPGQIVFRALRVFP